MGQRFSTANPHKGVTYGTDGTTVSSCLFCDIAGGQGSGDAITPLLYEDERVAVFRPRRVSAATHLLVVPRRHVATPATLQPADLPLMDHMRGVGGWLLRQEGGATAPAAGGALFCFHVNGHNSIDHLHLHCFSGAWRSPWKALVYKTGTPWCRDFEAVRAALSGRDSTPYAERPGVTVEPSLYRPAASHGAAGAVGGGGSAARLVGKGSGRDMLKRSLDQEEAAKLQRAAARISGAGAPRSGGAREGRGRRGRELAPNNDDPDGASGSSVPLLRRDAEEEEEEERGGGAMAGLSASGRLRFGTSGCGGGGEGSDGEEAEAEASRSRSRTPPPAQGVAPHLHLPDDDKALDSLKRASRRAGAAAGAAPGASVELEALGLPEMRP